MLQKLLVLALIPALTFGLRRPMRPFSKLSATDGGLSLCDYYAKIGKLDEHPECMKAIEATRTTTPRPAPAVCSINAALIQCTSDTVSCPKSGQICTQSDGSECCQDVTVGIPVSHINAKPGRCPQPLGISALQDTTVGCWLDTNCPGIQKCCLEPNPVTNTATRICRDPEGISSDSVCNLPLAIGSCTAPSIRYYYDASAGRCNSMTYSGCGGNANNFQSLASCQATCSGSGLNIYGEKTRIRGTPACPAEANAGINCLYAQADACASDSDCLGRENTVQPSCCLNRCACVDKFCPPGTFCATLNVVQCVKEPCKPLLACLPVSVNGCANHKCPPGMVCVEHSTRCIGRSCKKVPKCAEPGTCAALVCPPSHICEANPAPKCVKKIFTESDVANLDREAQE
ncbi:hypothetical protein FO519_002449 [Halicephalobus sp. NKZ332]|nr:hypothetical protein FO519_002449 [Halicephalobus sp. NKZ332]